MSETVAIDPKIEGEREEEEQESGIDDESGRDNTKRETETKESKESTERSSEPKKSETESTKCFVAGLSYVTTDAALRNFLDRFDGVVSSEIMRFRDTGKSRGFGFAFFRTKEQAEKACKESRKHTLDGREVEIQVAKSREELQRGGHGGYGRGRGRRGGRGSYRGGYGRGRGYHYDRENRGHSSREQTDLREVRKLFVGGIHPDTTQRQFEEYFSKFGNVEKAILKTDMNTGKVRGFGFVTFEEVRSADDCVKIGYHNLNGKEMECVKAYPKEGERDGPPTRGDGYTSSFTSSYYRREDPYAAQPPSQYGYSHPPPPIGSPIGYASRPPPYGAAYGHQPSYPNPNPTYQAGGYGGYSGRDDRAYKPY